MFFSPCLQFNETHTTATHPLIDCVSVSSIGKQLVLVTMDFSDSQKERIPQCHVYTFKSHAAAKRLAGLISSNRASGFANVSVCVRWLPS